MVSSNYARISGKFSPGLLICQYFYKILIHDYKVNIQEMNGIIIPPAAIKQTVDKTAFHVAKNGSQFEKALIQMQQNKPEFAFLKKENPYRAFYDHMVAEYSKKIMAQNAEVHQQAQQVKQEVAKIQKQIQQNDEQAQFLQKVFEEVKQPDPDKYSAQVPQKLTRAEMAMIQHTAQYVAINGNNFLIALSERQKNNPQFQFLRQLSNNHVYFRKIVASYTHILQLGEEQQRRLQEYIKNKDSILDKCKQAYQYYRSKQQRSKGNKDQTQNKKQSNVDWNDFQLVQTIIFDDFQPKKGYSEQFKLNKPLFSNKNLQEKIISEPKRKQLLQQCHVCKKNILATEMTKHLKTCIGGGNKNSQNNNNPSSQQNPKGDYVNVSKNLQSLSTKRPDIFGGEAQGIRKQQKNEQEQRIVWDGQAPNMTRTTASIAMLQNQQKKMKQQMKDSK